MARRNTTQTARLERLNQMIGRADQGPTVLETLDAWEDQDAAAVVASSLALLIIAESWTHEERVAWSDDIAEAARNVHMALKIHETKTCSI